MTDRITAVYIKQNDSYVAYLEDLPGVNTQGHTIEEAAYNLADALQEYTEANRMIAEANLNSADGRAGLSPAGNLD